MNKRIGMGKGKGKGYKNLAPKDPKVHKDSAMGRKQPQFINEPYGLPYKLQPTGKFRRKMCVAGSSSPPPPNNPYDAKRHSMCVRGAKREIVPLFRVAYADPKTPIELREYQISPSSPVGTIKEYADFFEGKNVKLEANLTIEEKRAVTRALNLKDTDGDGVADILDCRPNDSTMQDDAKFTDVDDFYSRQKSLAPSDIDEQVVEVSELTANVPDKPTIGSRVAKLGKAGLTYVSDLAKARSEKREAFESEVQNLNEKQLKELAVRYVDNSLFGNYNPYENELLRREKERNRVEKVLADEKKRAKEDAKRGSSFF